MHEHPLESIEEKPLASFIHLIPRIPAGQRNLGQRIQNLPKSRPSLASRANIYGGQIRKLIVETTLTCSS